MIEKRTPAEHVSDFLRTATSENARAVADEVGSLRRQLVDAKALLTRAVTVLVDEEMDRDFGEEPSARVLEVRAILDAVGFAPERCSMGAVIGRSGSPEGSTP